MKQTHNGITYELVSERIEGILQLDCTKCAAGHSYEICLALGAACIGKGVWRVCE